MRKKQRAEHHEECASTTPAAFPASPQRFAQAGRIAQRLNVRPGQTPVHTGDGWAGENYLRFASSLAAAMLDGLCAHPAWLFNVVSTLNIRDGGRGQNELFPSLLGEMEARRARWTMRDSLARTWETSGIFSDQDPPRSRRSTEVHHS